MPANPELAAGTLDRRVTLQQPVLNADQDEIDSWSDVATVWAAIEPKTGTEQDEGGRVVAVTDVEITVRIRGDIDTRWRVRETYTGVVYEVRSIVSPLRRGAGLTLTCREVK